MKEIAQILKSSGLLKPETELLAEKVINSEAYTVSDCGDAIKAERSYVICHQATHSSVGHCFAHDCLTDLRGWGEKSFQSLAHVEVAVSDQRLSPYEED